MKKKWYKKWWIWVLLGILTIGIISSGADSELKDTQKQDSQLEVKDETSDEIKEDITNDVVEEDIVKDEDSATNDLLAWEFITLVYFPKTDCQIIKDNIPGYTDNLEVIKIAEAALAINTEYNETFYVSYYIAGEHEGEIAAIDTSEKNYKLRTRLYPKKDIEYFETSIDDLTDKWVYDNTYSSTINKNKIEYEYFELKISIDSLQTTTRQNDTIVVNLMTTSTKCRFIFIPQTVDIYEIMNELNLNSKSKVLVKIQISLFDGDSRNVYGLIHDIELIN